MFPAATSDALARRAARPAAPTLLRCGAASSDVHGVSPAMSPPPRRGSQVRRGGPPVSSAPCRPVIPCQASPASQPEAESSIVPRTPQCIHPTHVLPKVSRPLPGWIGHELGRSRPCGVCHCRLAKGSAAPSMPPALSRGPFSSRHFPALSVRWHGHCGMQICGRQLAGSLDHTD